MADISKVFISIDLYSSTLDKLIKKTDEAVSKLLKVSSATKVAIANMNAASNTANKAADKLSKSATGMSGMIDRMEKVGESTLEITDKLKAAGASADNAADKFQDAADTFEEITSKMEKSGEATKKATDKVEKSGNIFTKAFKKIKSAKDGLTGYIDGKVGDLFSTDNLKNSIKLIDDMARASSKLGAVNDGSQTNEQLKEKIFAASGRSRGSSMDMMDSVTKLESTTGDLFKSNNETIAFSELAQKSFVAGGGSREERSSSMAKLTDSMAGGGLKGEDLQALSQTAPAIVDAIASYTGATGSELQTLADQGTITADVIKNAMFAASDQINASFADAPMTFEDSWAMIKEGGLQAFSEIMEKVTSIISMPEFGVFINGLIAGISWLASGVSWLIETIINGWSTIGPLLGVAAIAVLAILTAHVIAMAFSWLLATWPILLVIGLILGVIALAMNLGVTWQEIIGFIGGLIGGFAAFFFNIFVAIWNIAADFANFFGNVFNDPISSLKILFWELALDVLGIVGSIVQGIETLLNQIPFIELNISTGVEGLKNDIEANLDKLKTESGYKEYVKKKDYMDIQDGAQAGFDFAMDGVQKVENSLNSLTNPFGEDMTQDLNVDPFQSVTPSNPLPIEGTGTGGAVNVEMPEDDLDYLREIAERDYIANVATNSLAPNISIQFGDVHENADADKLAARISEILQNEIAMASEGVY